MDRYIQSGGKQSGKSAMLKQHIAKSKAQGKKVSIVDTKQKQTPPKPGKSKLPYSNQYGSWDGIKFKKAKGGTK